MCSLGTWPRVSDTALLNFFSKTALISKLRIIQDHTGRNQPYVIECDLPNDFGLLWLAHFCIYYFQKESVFNLLSQGNF